MGTLSDGHGPLLVHSSKLLPLIVALEILYTWDGDYFNFNYALVWPRYYTGMVPEALAHCNWCGLGLYRYGPRSSYNFNYTLVALEDPDLETWYWRGPCMTQRGPSDSEDLGD